MTIIVMATIDGFDTSSAVIGFALMEIGLNKDIQDRLRKEINEAMPNEEDFTYDNILNLVYLEQIWNGKSSIIFIRTVILFVSAYRNTSSTFRGHSSQP